MDIVIEEKKQTKKELRGLRQNGTSPSEVKLLADRFHHLVRQHSKLAKEARHFSAKASAEGNANLAYTSFPSCS